MNEDQKTQIARLFEGVRVDERPTTIRFNEESEDDRIDATLEVADHSIVPISFVAQGQDAAHDWESVGKRFFLYLTDRSYDGVQSYDDLWSDNSNRTVLGMLKELCEHFGINQTQLEEFIRLHRKCDYCGERNAPNEDEDGEHICEECLKEMS